MDIKFILSIILIVALVILSLGYLLYTKQYNKLKFELLKLVVRAELILEKGDDKIAYVTNRIYPKLPAFIKTFYSEASLALFIHKLINKSVDNIKDEIEGLDIESTIKEIKNK